MNVRAVLVLCLLSGCGASGGSDDDVSGPDAGLSGPDAAPGQLLLVEEFADDGAWPAGWTELGGVSDASVVSGRGRLVPDVSGYSLARMGHDLDAADVEVRFSLAMETPSTSGVGFYVRQSGGYLTQSEPVGGGYAVFVEAFRGPRIGLWRERDGAEEELGFVALDAVDAGAVYQVRFRCVSDGATTALAAKIWPDGAAEPSGWTVTTSDDLAALQGVSGGVAVDAWSTATPEGGVPSAISVDDVEVSGS
jgi:hypothetical protein